jgi:RND family efflux transporter MFP subunit
VSVKVGDFVKQGQILVQLDDELKAIARDQAKVQLIAAETNLSKAQKDLERAEKLRAAGDISDTEFEAYRLAFRSADAQHKAAQVGLRAAQRQFDDARIKAPVSGYVASRRVELGEMVKSGDQIANIVDLAKVKVKLSIPEEEIGKLRTKQTAVLRLDAAPEKTFTGLVYSVGSKTETPTGHTYPVEVVVENKDVNLMKAGMFARVEIKAHQIADALTISKESLVNEDTEPGVFVAENNIAKLHHVKLGIRSGDIVQVIEGLRAGDLVISFGQKKLKDGVPVQFKQ